MEWWMEQAEGFRGRIDRREQFKWLVPLKMGRLRFDTGCCRFLAGRSHHFLTPAPPVNGFHPYKPSFSVLAGVDRF